MRMVNINNKPVKDHEFEESPNNYKSHGMNVKTIYL